MELRPRLRHFLCFAGSALALTTALPASTLPQAPDLASTVVVILVDGVAEKTLALAPTPQLDRFLHEGSYSHHLVPAFPTMSHTNGVTLSTGCWPGRHGIVNNKFIDPERGRFDHHPDADWTTGCQHLHEVAEKHGVRAATLGWYGSHSSSRGALASTSIESPAWRALDDLERARRVAEQIRRTDGDRPRLILAYFSGPDDAQHYHGMNSVEAERAVEKTDRSIGIVRDAIEESSRADTTVLLIVTDHGMRPVTHLLNVRKILLNAGVEGRWASSGAVAMVYLDDKGSLDEAHGRLLGRREFDVFRTSNPPPYANLSHHPRAGDLVLVAKPPFFIEDHDEWPKWLQWLSRWGPESAWAVPFFKASHGYPPSTSGMHGVFYAWGPGRTGRGEIESLRAIDLHPTVTWLLGIEPGQPVDGEAQTELFARAGALARTSGR